MIVKKRQYQAGSLALDRAGAAQLCSHMTQSRTPLALLRRIGLMLMLVPFVLLALIPAAAMPMQGADGRFVMVLCTPEGRVDVLFDPATGEVSDLPAKAPGTCDWATATGTVALNEARVLPTEPQILTLTPPAPQNFAYAPAHDPRGLYARGPPTLI